MVPCGGPARIPTADVIAPESVEPVGQECEVGGDAPNGELGSGPAGVKRKVGTDGQPPAAESARASMPKRQAVDDPDPRSNLDLEGKQETIEGREELRPPRVAHVQTKSAQDNREGALAPSLPPRRASATPVSAFSAPNISLLRVLSHAVLVFATLSL